jgi:secondary thiamine-phosphate synthase enzyme
MVRHAEFPVRTRARNQLVDISPQVQHAVDASGLVDGICTVASAHTTAGITINENADPDVARDILHTLAEMIPQHAGFHHAEGNSDSHIKASLVGLSVTVPVKQGRMVLGAWQSVYFCEFDGPRNRTAMVTVIGE